MENLQEFGAEVLAEIHRGTWYEAFLELGADPADLYDEMDGVTGVLLFHHFFDEPWHRNRYVVRVLATADQEASVGDWLSSVAGVVRVRPWNARPDVEMYGVWWPFVGQFFQASSVLASTSEYRVDQKLVHCYLNARGMGAGREALFALRFFWNRATITVRWHLYLRRRWERAQSGLE